MTWTCQTCGHSNEGSSGTCAGCGELTIQAISLIAVATGNRLTLRIDTDIGRRVLATLGDEDARFASEVQFRVAKSKELGGWSVCNDPGARNPTFLNGAPLPPGPQRIDTGAVLSIGAEKMKIRVETGAPA